MQPKYVALILAYVSAAMTSPLGTTPDGLVEQSRETAVHSNGTMIWYDGPSGDSSLANIAQRGTCHYGGDAPKCDTKHNARNTACDALMTELYADGDTAVPGSPRQICYQGDAADNGYCCMSWHRVVPGLQKRDLADPGNTIFRSCTSNGISGKIDNIWVHGTCTNVCLSNRGTGC